MDGIVQNELFIGTELGLYPGLSCLFFIWSSFMRMKVASCLSLSSCYVRQVSFPAIHIS